MALSFQDKIRPTSPVDTGLSFASKIKPVAPTPIEEEDSSLWETVKGAVSSYSRTTQRIGIDIAAGELQTVASIASGLDWLGIKPAGKVAVKLNEAVARATPPDVNFGDKLAQGAGSAATFFVPGLGIAKGVQLVSYFGKAAYGLGMLFGNAASTALEAMSEAGSVYDQSKQEGKSEKDASGRATNVFWANALLIGLTNKFGAFSDETAGMIKRILLSAPTEAVQEGSQQVISNLATDRAWNEGVAESALIGGILGGAMGGIVGLAIPPRLEDEMKEKAKEMIDAGSSPTETTLALADKIPVEKAKEIVAGLGIETVADLPDTGQIAERIKAGETPTAIELELASTLGTDQAGDVVEKAVEEVKKYIDSIKPPVKTAVEQTEKAFLDIEKEVDEAVLAQTPSDFMEQFNSFQEKTDADSKALRDQVAELEKKVTEATPRSQEKKDAKIALEAERKKLREADDAAQNKIYEHALGLREFLSNYIQTELGLNIDEAEVGNVVDDITMLITDGNFGANVWNTPIADIAKQIVNEYKAEQQPSEPAPTAKKEIKTAEDAAKDMLRVYVHRGKTLKQVQAGSMGAALPGSYTVNLISGGKIKVSALNGKELEPPVILSLKKIYDELVAEKKEVPTKKEPAKKETAKKPTGVQVGDVIETSEGEKRIVTSIEKRSVFFRDDKGQDYSGFSLPTLKKLLKEGAWKLVEGDKKTPSLTEIASGYASAKEFADAVIYHGTNEDAAGRIARNGFKGTQVSFSWDFETAQSYTNQEGEGEYRAQDVFAAVPRKGAENIGTDAVDKLTGEDIYAPSDVVIIGRGKQTKKQLTDFYNSAIDKKGKVQDDKGNDKGTDDSGGGDNAGGVPQPLPDSGDKPGGAGENVAGKRGGKQQGSPAKRGGTSRERLGARLTNEEVEKIVSSVAVVSKDSHREIKLVGEITDEVLEAANQYAPGGETKTGRGILDEYYTASQVVDMVKSLLDLPATKLKVLEPSVGTGNFLYALPETTEHAVAALEVNETTAKIAKIFHPTSRVFASPFENVFMDERGKAREFSKDFDLVIGNPPYGEHRGRYLGLGEEKKLTHYEEYFLKRGIDVLKEGGTLAMVIPSSFLRRATNTSLKFNLPKEAELVNAFRLPNGAFAGTDIGTDIVIFKKSKAKNDKVRLERNGFLINDAFFKANPNNVLGVTEKQSGRFGDEDVVKGTLDEAITRFYAEHSRPEAIALLKGAKLPATEENIASAEATIEESGEKAAELIEADKQKEVGKKTIEKKVVQKVVAKTGETVALQSRFKTQHSEAELALWKKTLPDGSVTTPTEQEKKTLNLMKGKWYLDFNYLQGDIYEKLDQLEKDSQVYGSEVSFDSMEQKQKLMSALPKQEKIEDIKISPNVGFAKDLSLDTGLLERPKEVVLKPGEKEAKVYNPRENKEDGTLRGHFLKWLNTLPNNTFGDSSRWEVRGYVTDEQVRGSDKDRNELIRVRRKIMADNLFGKFLREELNAEQKTMVEDAYNRTFNFFHTPDFSKVPMFSNVHGTFKGAPFVLYEAQRAGIGRIVNSGVGILAHEVGFGKTISGVMAAHEIMMRGWAKKPLFVVPGDSHASQWADTIQELVPDAKINILGNLGVGFKGDLSSLSIPDGSFSLITFEGFKRLAFKDDTYNKLAGEFQYIGDELETHRKTEREQEKHRAQKEGIEGKMKKGTRADLFFEDLGFDYMTFDEVQNANHIVSKVKLKEGQSSEFNRFGLRPSDLGVKTWLAAQYVQKQNGGRNINLLSATPFTNHPLEYYSILSLVADLSLHKMGFRNVNDFFGTFMEAEHEYEFKADGTYQKKTDIRRFRNFRQFRKLLDSYIDFRQETSDLKRPNRVQINYEIPKNTVTRDLEAQAQAIFKENEREKGKGAKTLRAITELRKIAFSPYASKFSPDVAPENYRDLVENSPKLATVMAIIAQNVKDRPDAGQIIYSEVGVEFFPMLKEYLQKVLGIKEVEIIRGGTPPKARLDIQERFNAGKVKILIGSEAISEGLNLQKNTSDMHLLSLPWNFTALRQVVGRAWRQGNRFGNVRINQYFIQDSVDVFMSQKLDNKQQRYENAMSSNSNEVDVGDVSYSEMKFDLIQDPETRAKMEVDEKKEQMKAQIVQEGAELAFALRKLEKINDLAEEIKGAEEGLKRENAKETPNEFWVSEHTKTLSKAKKEMNEEIKKLRDKSIDIDTLLQHKTEAEKKIADLEATVKKIEETLPERIKEIAASLPPRQDFSPAVIAKFVAERAEHNKTFYTVAEAPTVEVARVAEEVKEIKNATGTKVVKTKKTTKLVKEPVKRKKEGGTRDERVLKILSSEKPVAEKVDAILEVKQAGKDFKDVGERVAGSRKESAAIRTVIGEGDSTVLAEMIRRLGWDAVSAVLNKQDILADVAKPDPVKDVSEGVPTFVAYVKKQFYDKIGRTMVFQNKQTRWGGGYTINWTNKTDERGWKNVLTDAKSEEGVNVATKAIEEYPTLLRELVEKLTAVKTFADLQAFDDWFTNNTENGGRFPAKYTTGSIEVELDNEIFGAVGKSKGVTYDWFSVYNKTEPKPSFYPTTRSLRRILGDYTEFSLEKKVIREYTEKFINDPKWLAKATKKKFGEAEGTELTHGNFKPLERIERSAEAIKDEEATAENLRGIYGFKSVQLGNYMDDATAREHIRHTIGAVVDMSNLLRIDFPKLMNAMGLSIAYGARGGGKANAHYEPGKRIINLTKGKGDGSFFHEFIHFLDYRTNSQGYRGSWSSKKDRWYTSNPLDQATADLMGAITGKRVRKVVEFKPQDDAYVLQRPENPIMKMYAEGKTLEEAIAFAPNRTDEYESGGRTRTYNISTSQTYQEIADVYRQVVSKEASVYHEETEYLKGSKKYGSDYWSRPEELLARAGQAYIEDKLAARGMTNNYLTRTTIAEDPESSMAKVYPQGEERKLFNTMFDRVFAELSARYPIGVEGTGARFRVVGKEKAEVTMTEAGAYLANVKERLNLDFDVHFVDALLNGFKIDAFTRQKTPIEAWGATFDNTIVLAKEMAKNTAPHEVVHLTMANMNKIPIFAREGINRNALMKAKAAEMGVKWEQAPITRAELLTDNKIEEAIAMDFEAYMKEKYPAKGIIRRFFATLKRLLMRFARAIVTTRNDIVRDYYDILDEGVETEETMVRLENAGAVEAFTAETGGEVLDMDTLEGDVPRFKLKEEPDKLLQDRKRKFNDLLNKQGQLEEDTLGWKTDLLKQVALKAQIAPEVEATTPNVKEAARFTNRRKDPVGQLTERGTVEVSKLDFANPQEAQEEIYAYLKRKAELVSTRNRLRDLRRKIAGAKGDSRTNKAAMRDVERKLKMRKRYLEQKELYVDMGIGRGKKEQMKVIWRRGRVIRDIQDQFAIGDKRAKDIIGGFGRQRVHLMTEQQFNDFTIQFFNRAQELGNKLSVQNEARAIIAEEQFQKWENLQKAMGLPSIEKMTEEQAQSFVDALSTYQFGDVFITQRQIETADRTEWGNVKTERELFAKLEGVMHFSREEMATLTARHTGEYTPWIRLARKHPFFNWLVGKRVEADIQATREYIAIEKDTNKIASAAIESRRKLMGVKEKIVDIVVPTQPIIRGFLEAKDKEAYETEHKMTKEEIRYAYYIIGQNWNFYEYLKQFGTKEIENYMTHSRRTFLEAYKDETFMVAIREVFTSQKEEEAGLTILDSETGKILAFDKFLGNMLHRSGKLVPSENVTRVFLEYARAVSKKRAMDKFVPEAMIAVQAHSAVVGTTKKGLTKDPTLERFVKEFLNDAKGRKIKFITKQGSMSDIALRAGIATVSLKYLGGNIALAIGNLFGDFTAISWELDLREQGRGVVRSIFHPIQSHEINKQFRYFAGRNPITEVFDPKYALPSRLKHALLALMGLASFQSNKFFLRSKMTDEEFNTGVINDARLTEIANSLSRVKPNQFYVKSLAGNTSAGAGIFQFLTWAIAPLNTVISDGGEVIKMLAAKKPKEAITSREAQKLMKFAILAGLMWVLVSLLFVDDEDDDDKAKQDEYTIMGRTKRSIRLNLNTLMDSMTILFSTGTDGNMRIFSPLIIKEITTIFTAINQFLSQERYKRDGIGFQIGDLKWIRTGERIITPSALRMLFPSEKESALETQVSEGIKTGVFDAEAVAKDISPDWDEMEEESRKRKVESVKRLYNIRKSHPDDPVVELLLNGDNNKERVEALIEYGEEVGEGKVYSEVKKLYRDPNVCADPKKRTGCLISGQLLKEYQKARRKL